MIDAPALLARDDAFVAQCEADYRKVEITAFAHVAPGRVDRKGPLFLLAPPHLDSYGCWWWRMRCTPSVRERGEAHWYLLANRLDERCGAERPVRALQVTLTLLHSLS